MHAYTQQVTDKDGRKRLMILSVFDLESDSFDASLSSAEGSFDGEELVIRIKPGVPARDLAGLDADQILLSKPFNLQTTRTREKADRLYELTIQARCGDDKAARELIREMAKGIGTNPDLPPEYDPKFGDDRLCTCGHAYYRHFDSYEEMEPVGCKYCGCDQFKEG